MMTTWGHKVLHSIHELYTMALCCYLLPM